MIDLLRTQNQDKFKEIRHQKKRLEEAYKAQLKYLDEREKELKTEQKTIRLAKKNLDFNFFLKESLSFFFSF
tara:strand:+ start:822 stop:1037 length:216 start_codon:yes stop_codon:yes gene_type:complete